MVSKPYTLTLTVPPPPFGSAPQGGELQWLAVDGEPADSLSAAVLMLAALGTGRAELQAWSVADGPRGLDVTHKAAFDPRAGVWGKWKREG